MILLSLLCNIPSCHSQKSKVTSGLAARIGSGDGSQQLIKGGGAAAAVEVVPEPRFPDIILVRLMGEGYREVHVHVGI